MLNEEILSVQHLDVTEVKIVLVVRNDARTVHFLGGIVFQTVLKVINFFVGHGLRYTFLIHGGHFQFFSQEGHFLFGKPCATLFLRKVCADRQTKC